MTEVISSVKTGHVFNHKDVKVVYTYNRCVSDHLSASYVGHIIPVKKANVSEPEFVSWLTYNEINSHFLW